MKITISSGGGVSRGVHLASCFDKKGMLSKLFVPYYSPKHPYLSRLLGRYYEDVPIDIRKVRTNIKVPLIVGGFSKLDLNKLFAIEQGWYFLDEMIDRNVSRQIDGEEDILFAQSFMALESMRRAKGKGVITVLDRTNAHVCAQREIMIEEYDLLRIKRNLLDIRFIERGLKEYEEADYICVLSSYVKRTFMEHGIPEEKLLLVPSGVDLKGFSQIPKEDNIFRLIYCGGINIGKGVHYLLEAFASLNLKDAELWLIGAVHDEIRPFLNKYIGCYKLFGMIRNSDLYRYYSQGSVFVLSSLQEGLAKVIMEAMACGLPVIATTNTGGEDVVRDGTDGFIVPIRDVQKLKEKILYMYENRSICYEMGQDAKERVSSGFTWDDYAARMIADFEKILFTRRPYINDKRGH